MKESIDCMMAAARTNLIPWFLVVVGRFLAAGGPVILSGCNEREDGRPSNSPTPQHGAGGESESPMRIATESAATTVMTIAEIDERVNRLGRVSGDDFDQLEELYKRNPADSRIEPLYVRGLRERGDFIGLQRHRIATRGDAATPQERAMLVTMLLDARRFHEAAEFVRPMLEASPGNPQYRWLAAQAAFGEGQLDGAEALLDGAWTGIMESGQLDALFLRGLIHFRREQFDEAESRLRELLATYPDHVPGNLTLGRVLSAQGRREEAEQYFRQATQLHEYLNAQETRRARAGSQIKQLSEARVQRRWDEVERLAQSVLPEFDEPRRADLYDVLAEAYEATGRFAEATSARRQAQSLRQSAP